jgi:hypothetical protein
MRLLISARDTGAAAHIAEIVPALRAARGVEVVLVADEPVRSTAQAAVQAVRRGVVAWSSVA